MITINFSINNFKYYTLYNIILNKWEKELAKSFVAMNKPNITFLLTTAEDEATPNMPLRLLIALRQNIQENSDLSFFQMRVPPDV